MDGIEKITERIAADADAEITSVLNAAKEQAAAIAADAEAKADAEAAAILARGKAEAAARHDRAISAAELAEKTALLGVKQELLTKVFDQAMEKLCSLPEDDYIELLAQLAFTSASTGTESLILSSADRSRIGKKVVARANTLLEEAGKTPGLTLDAESRPIRGGLYVKAGKIEDNCSLETIVRLLHESQTAALADILFT